MKKFTSLLLTILLAVFALGGYADAAQKRFQAQAYKFDQTKQIAGQTSASKLLATGITYKVLVRNSNTAETILASRGPSGSAVTAKTNPVTTTVFAVDGKIDFVADPTDALDTYVDLIVTDTNGGYSAFIEDFTANQRTVVIDETPGIPHTNIIWFAASSEVETDTGVDFLANTIITDCRVEVVTTDSAKTLSVGLLSTETAGNASGLRSGVLMTTAGFVKDTGVITGGSTIDYTAASTYGSLLYTAITGSDAVATVGGRSYLGHVVTGTNAKSLTYTGSAGSTTAAGYIYTTFMRLR